MVAIRTGRLGKLGSHLLMSPDFRGTCVAESPARATVRAGSGQSGGQDKAHTPLGTTVASEPKNPLQGPQSGQALPEWRAG